jgi:hypothetical protein
MAANNHQLAIACRSSKPEPSVFHTQMKVHASFRATEYPACWALTYLSCGLAAGPACEAFYQSPPGAFNQTSFQADTIRHRWGTLPVDIQGEICDHLVPFDIVVELFVRNDV